MTEPENDLTPEEFQAACNKGEFLLPTLPDQLQFILRGLEECATDCEALMEDLKNPPHDFEKWESLLESIEFYRDKFEQLYDALPGAGMDRR